MKKNKLNFEEKIYNNIVENNLIETKDKLLVAVSGGPDSISLLNCLINLKKEYNLDYEIYVAHVNHKIRKEANEEKEFVNDFCNKNNIPFFYLEKDVENEAKKLKLGTEEYGRKIRYEFFNKVLNENNLSKIVIAHNKNDNAETVLLNLIRGSSLKGLTGIEFKTGNIIRPMLNIEKEEVLEYCKNNKIEYCIDKTNFMPIYNRNKIRLDLIPYIEKEFNPNIIDTIYRMSTLNKLDEEFLEKYVNKLIDETVLNYSENYIKFNYNTLLNEEKGIKYRYVREIIKKVTGNVTGIESKHVIDIIRLFENNITGKKYIIGNKFEIKIVKKNLAEINFK